jgi:hypothetical protein
MQLTGDAYQIAGVFDVNQEATSVLLPDFSVSVQAAFQAGEAGVT